MSSSADPKFGETSEPGKQNNEIFKLEALFDVKDRVALVTGDITLSNTRQYANTNAMVQVAALGLA